MAAKTDIGITLSGPLVDSDSEVDEIVAPRNQVTLRKVQWTAAGPVQLTGKVALSLLDGEFVSQALPDQVFPDGTRNPRPAIIDADVNAPDLRSSATGWGLLTPRPVDGKKQAPREYAWQFDAWKQSDEPSAPLFATIILWAVADEDRVYVMWGGPSPDYTIRPKTVAHITAWNKSAA